MTGMTADLTTFAARTIQIKKNFQQTKKTTNSYNKFVPKKYFQSNTENLNITIMQQNGIQFGTKI